MDRASHTEIVAGTPAQCFAALLDFEGYPQWQSAVRECNVHERDEDGRGSLIECVIDLKIRRIRYVLRYHYDEPRRAWWDYVEGDVRSIDGEYRFEELGDGTTSATYEVGLDPGRFVPGPVRRMLTEVAMRASVRELKARVEGAAGC